MRSPLGLLITWPVANAVKSDSSGVSGAATSGPVVQVKPVSNLNDLRSVMVRYCQQMSDEAQKQFNSLLLSDVTLEHILKIHRVITMTRWVIFSIATRPGEMP